MRYFWEISNQNERWVSYANGGDSRKYAGNELQFVDWSHEARAFYDSHGGLSNSKFWNKEGITWSLITSAINSFRIKPTYSEYSSGSPTIFNEFFFCDKIALSFLNSPITNYYLEAINPTINTGANDVFALPFPEEIASSAVIENTDRCIYTSKADWDSYETSWNFNSLPLLKSEYYKPTVQAAYQMLRSHWLSTTLEMQRLEQKNNRVFIEAYGLQDELAPDVPLNEITLTCNPHYRYGGDKNEEELEVLLLADSMRELISYAVGCMFGRYALEKLGLVLANQGETIEDYRKQVPESAFPADDDNVIPMLDGNWFTDDIVERFRKFLRVTFGAEHYEENLRFVEKALNVKNKRNYSIRDYFLGEFYNDHVKRYKKRPIYWLFSSPKGSFNALICTCTRYRPDTVSVVLNDYLREFRAKLASHKTNLEAVGISAGATQGEKTKALKEIDKINKMIAEMEEYEHEALYPLATEQVELDLDDGVKVNYPKLGPALKKIPGLSTLRRIDMHICNLTLEGFRGAQHLKLELHENLNVFVGINGAGKTTILDAAAILLSWLVNRIISLKSSGRPIVEAEIMSGYHDTVLEITLEYEGVSYRWDLTKARKGHVRRYRASELASASKLAGQFQSKITKNAENANLPLLAYYPVNRVVVNIPLRISGKQRLGLFSAYDDALSRSADFRTFFQWFREREDLENEAIRDKQSLIAE